MAVVLELPGFNGAGPRASQGAGGHRGTPTVGTQDDDCSFYGGNQLVGCWDIAGWMLGS